MFISGCFICCKKLKLGPPRDEGRYIPSQKILVCDTCYAVNWDGWNPRHEETLIAHFEAHNIEIPARNNKGLLPRGHMGIAE